ncbi:fatty acyl-AMP ligase [Shimazuella sp. AN120528]|uniref:fatty acyl-AMP ligase n=1 Tax=Shimazuella soli TaxID=1892854 RepID=UPI001F0F3FF3|nr:fatty acyl-AMP ligase [Shimazuella soli]MCH5586568.1 fatty acyl-AMP ligase [Shimazuella soli]
MGKLKTWIEVIQEQSAIQPEKEVFTFLRDIGGNDSRLTFQELEQRMSSIGTHLAQVGATGQRVLILLEPSMNYILAFLGCLYAKAIAVPAYPPNMKKQFGRLINVIQDSKAKYAITSRAIYDKLRNWTTEEIPFFNWLLIEELPQNLSATQTLDWEANDIAFLQYTSGSTGNPKGVILNHTHLIENGYRMMERWDIHQDAKIVSWLPPYHDMGLIGTILTPILAGTKAILMTPYHFVQRPIRWLQALSDNKAEISISPNFGFDLCVDKIKVEKRDELNLSHWRVAVNGSEPVRPATLRKFAGYFAPVGFKPEALYPGYGTAETTLMISGGNWREKPVFKHFDANLLEEGIAKVVEPDAENARELVGNGQSVYDHEVIIVDPETRMQLADGRVGEIWVKGPCVSLGYWENEEATRYAFHAFTQGGKGPFLRTGDQGFYWDQELYINARLKDLIIINGRNYAPSDIEWEIERAHNGIRKNANAAFSIDHLGRERLIIVTEVENRILKNVDNPIQLLTNIIRKAVSQSYEIPVYDIVYIKRGTILKTSSGKIQRQAIRKAYLTNQLVRLEAKKYDKR